MAELSSSAAVLEIGTAAPWVRKWASAWVRGPVWDGFWMLSALWLAPIVLLLVPGYSYSESGPLDLLYFGLTALFWIGHRLSSSYLAYCTEAYRPLLREQPGRFIALPVLVTAGGVALFLPAGGRFAVGPRGPARRAGNPRLRLRDPSLRRAAFRRALPLPRARRTCRRRS